MHSFSGRYKRAAVGYGPYYGGHRGGLFSTGRLGSGWGSNFGRGSRWGSRGHWNQYGMFL